MDHKPLSYYSFKMDITTACITPENPDTGLNKLELALFASRADWVEIDYFEDGCPLRYEKRRDVAKIRDGSAVIILEYACIAYEDMMRGRERKEL
ncbi:hypothetical protein HYX12_00855 [Candidatus Woesearchaeota archaeon]|nr:hypothetical protein [Candidatus Woesearchaeota archaeon]